MNRIVVTGNVTNTPTLQFSKSGEAFLKFGIAENVSRKINGEWVEEAPTFYQVTCFKAAAEALTDVLDKGMGVRVEGSLRVSKYSKDGQDRQSLEIAGDVFLVPKLKRAERPDLDEPPF